MANTVQLTKNGQPVFPVTDVSLVMGLQDAIKLPPVKVTTLPTASSETAGKIYYVGPDGNDEYERYITSAAGGSYEWIDLGNTAIPLPSIADNLTTDDANTALSAKQGKVLDGKVSQLGQEVTGNIVKEVTWSNGYVQSATGLIKTSSLSQFSQPILLKAGEKVIIGTQNSNIGIICSTNADSVSIGDTVTVIKATSSSGQFETYEYTAEADIKIVLCVLASNYNLSFYDTDNLTEKVSNAATKQELDSLDQELGGDITQLRLEVTNDISQLEAEVNGEDKSQDFEFSIATGGVHYTKTVNVKAGKYNITVDDANNALPQYTRIYLNGTSIGYLKSLTNPVTIANDVTTMMLYANDQATNSGDITIHFEDTQSVPSLDDRISSLEETSEGMYEDVNSLKVEVNGDVKMEWHQGSIYTPTGKISPGNTRVTNLNPLPLPIKVKSSSTIYVVFVERYKDGKSPETGGVTDTDWIEESLSPADMITITKNNEFPNTYITLRKPNSSDPVSVSEVENDITLEYVNALVPRVDELEKGNKSILIDFGTQTPSDGNTTKFIWLDSPAKFSDYSEMIFRTHLSGQMSNQVLLYAIYSQDPNDYKRVLPGVYENTDSVISIPSNDRESLYGLMLYNLYGVSYSFGASLELVSKNESVKHFDDAERSANLLPAYYFADNYIYKKRDIINKYLRENILLGDAFFFVTDTHWEFNQKHSPALIKELSRKLNIQRVFHGGDIYNNSPVVDTFEVDCINSFRDAVGNDKVAVAQGNHEYLGNDTWADVFVEASMHLENAKFGSPNKQYFYIDNPVKKIRYIVLYSYGQRVGGSYTYGYNDQEQLTWLSGTALNVESGWDIFIFTHYAVSPVVNGDEYTRIAGFENVAAIINGYTGAGRIVAMITGHTHRDYVLLESLDVPIIVTTCDHNANFLYNGVRDFDNLQTPRDSETIDEQAFDAVIYDRVNCLFHFIRIGSEADNKMNLLTTNTQVAVRSIYCTTKAVNDTVELPTYLTSGVTWESSDTSVATVSSGTVSCVGVGCVRITATDSNGEKQSFYLRVENS